MGNEKEINALVRNAQEAPTSTERKEAIERIYKKLKPFRFALAKKFSNKGVEFDDIVQQIDLKLLEAIYDYDEDMDPSALRHLTSKARNGIWNYYRKEMNYFNTDKSTISLDAMLIQVGTTDYLVDFYSIIDGTIGFDEDAIIDKITISDEISKLTPHQKEVLFMIFIDDMTQYSIAEELKINQANVSRAKKRGIESLRGKFTGDEHY